MQLIVLAAALLAGFGLGSAKSLRLTDQEKEKYGGGAVIRSGTRPASEAAVLAFEQKLAALPADDAALRSFASVPVYFHVLMSTDGHGAVSDAQVNNQLNVLRAAFKGVNFNLQNVQRITNDRWFNLDTDEIEREMKTALRQGGANALNVYTLNAVDALGFTSWSYNAVLYPGDHISDGVAVDYNVLPGGNFNNYNLGDSMVHEVGHWFGLEDIFFGSCAYLGRMGDRVRDTPAAKGPNFRCVQVDSCPGSTKGYKGKDLIHNYMDFGDDHCIDSFTPGQFARMRDMWRTIRKP